MTLQETLNKNDRFARNIGATLTEVREGYSRAELYVTENHLNGADVCQGGVYFTLADLAFAAVANSRGIVTLGITNTITYIRSAKLGDHLIAECEEKVNHHKLPYCDITVKNQNGELLAIVTGMGYRLKKEFEFDRLM